ncbi:GDCCVxC domain-containing (seleno)protein [Antarctobacter sp.]|uniref:GDCCVxC domain-containing (seleno)protein n=1 Tax=Antarctobacter sp. TaxID=1872577 RepID=UPI002B27793C|nr:GDCCVxC domain-containing (seleno)protein [Antarctobacter sp.]
MTDLVLISVLTCSACNARHEEQMPTDACQFFWECPSCKTVVRPKPGDCCVYCSYGTIPCPPIQEGKGCCA